VNDRPEKPAGKILDPAAWKGEDARRPLRVRFTMNRTFRCPGFPGTGFRSGAVALGGLLALLMSGILAAQAPRIELTAVPPLGSTQDLAGLVANAVPANHRVAVYIYVGGWWNKPSHGAPQSVIQADGTWTSDITTGGADVAATRVAAFLIPATWSPPFLSGPAVLPPALAASSRAAHTKDGSSFRAISGGSCRKALGS